MQPPTTSTHVATAWFILVPVSNPTFYCPSRDGRRKAATIPAMTSTVRPSCPEIFGARPYPFPIDPPQPRPDPASTAISQTKEPRPVHRPQGITRPLQHPGYPADPSSTSPQRPRDGLHAPGHVATATPTVLASPSPPRHLLGFVVSLILPLSL
jgi:hypothetical protein